MHEWQKQKCVGEIMESVMEHDDWSKFIDLQFAGCLSFSEDDDCRCDIIEETLKRLTLVKVLHYGLAEGINFTVENIHEISPLGEFYFTSEKQAIKYLDCYMGISEEEMKMVEIKMEKKIILVATVPSII